MWYFVDRRQQRHGPVGAGQLRAAYRRGDLSRESLVWREGLAQWLPLEQLAAELELDGDGDPRQPAATEAPPTPELAPPAEPEETTAAAPQPPAPPAAGGPRAGAAGTGLSRGCLIAIIASALLPVVVIVIAVLAAIAIPAYADYTGRAQVSAAIASARPARAAIESFYSEVGRCPRDAAEVALSQPTAAALRELRLGEDEAGRCLVEIALGRISGPGGVDGGNIVLTRRGTEDWTCASDLPARLLPRSCR